MPRKSQRLHRQRQSTEIAAGGKRVVKDEKAKYERRRRRRWGIINKANQYSTLFGEDVYLLIKDDHKAQYFTTAEGWISSPQQMGAVRVFAPGSQKTRPGPQSVDLDESFGSECESVIPSVETTGDQEPTSSALQRIDSPGCCSAGDVHGTYNNFIDCLHKLRNAFKVVGEVFETAEMRSSNEDGLGSPHKL